MPKNRPIGKVACLSKKLRDMVNHMLQDGVRYNQIIERLKSAGHTGLTPDNISRWYLGSYKTWEAEQARLEDMKAKREFAFKIVRENAGSRIHEAGLLLAASQLYDLVAEFDLDSLKELLKTNPENYTKVVDTLTKLSKGALDLEKFKANVAEQKRKIEAELGASKAEGLTPEAITKIEEALNLL
jgi:hypothetical protein